MWEAVVRAPEICLLRRGLLDKPQHPRAEKAAFAAAPRNCLHRNMYSPAWPSAHVVSILLGVSYGKMCLYVTKMQGVEVERGRKNLFASLGAANSPHALFCLSCTHFDFTCK